MNLGETATRASIWLALAAYGLSLALWLSGRRGATTRWVWTIGCACFLTHVACAFGFYHHWSHAEAYRETARQTGEMTGLHWGGGLYLNYLFGALWLGDSVWWWTDPQGYVQRSTSWRTWGHGFFLFMIFNGTIVFGHGVVRWAGALLFTILAALWWRRRQTPA